MTCHWIVRLSVKSYKVAFLEIQEHENIPSL